MLITLTLSGNTSELAAYYFPPIELKGNYECVLVDFHTYNSIPNIDDSNHLMHIGDNVIKLPIGSYELEDVAELANDMYDMDNPEKFIEIEANNNTMQVILNSSHDLVHFDKPNSIGKLLGFKPRVLIAGEDH